MRLPYAVVFGSALAVAFSRQGGSQAGEFGGALHSLLPIAFAQVAEGKCCLFRVQFGVRLQSLSIRSQ